MAKIENQKMIAHLTAKWQNRPCPMCGSGPWNVQDSSFQLTEFNQGVMVLGGPVIPVVPVVCVNCGNTVLVNGIIAHVIDAAPTAKPEPPK
jgi:hypothetical protein